MDWLEYNEFGEVVAVDEVAEVSTYDLRESKKKGVYIQLPLFDLPEQKVSRGYVSYLNLFMEDYWRRRRRGEDTRAWRWEMTNQYGPKVMGKMWYVWRNGYVAQERAA